jgi:hypothetical protein
MMRPYLIGSAALCVSVAIYWTMAAAHAQSAFSNVPVSSSQAKVAFVRAAAEPWRAEHQAVACMLVRMNRFSGDERFNHHANPCPPLNARQSGRNGPQMVRRTWAGQVA